jgi:hypothetical protein
VTQQVREPPPHRGGKAPANLPSNLARKGICSELQRRFTGQHWSTSKKSKGAVGAESPPLSADGIRTFFTPTEDRITP